MAGTTTGTQQIVRCHGNGSEALFAARKPLSGIFAAVDRDQAGLDCDHVARIVSLNPWLSKVIEVLQWKVVNKHTGSTMKIMASDVASTTD